MRAIQKASLKFICVEAITKYNFVQVSSFGNCGIGEVKENLAEEVFGGSVLAGGYCGWGV